MSENKYEQRVLERAEEMAKACLAPSLDSWIREDHKLYLIKKNSEKLLPAARLSVQREAEAVEEALEFLHQSIYSSELGKKHCARYLQSLGLVPENEPDQEAGKV